MSSKVTIVMYHYVRDLKHSRYPEIKGLDISLFNEQIEYLRKHYNFISMEMLIDAVENNINLPERAVLLTFDDAYIDHFRYVFPILNKHKIQGSFFPPVKAITEHIVLDVNKIHFILASELRKTKILHEIKTELIKYRDEYNLENYEFYYKKLAQESRYDTADVVFIKRLFQSELNENIRTRIVNNLFEKIVGIDEESFSRELYMDIEQIKCMRTNGMHIGSHGYDHYWLGSLSYEKQNVEIEKSAHFLDQLGCKKDYMTMCYPYGNYNNSTIELLKEFNFKLALSTEVDVADIKKNNKYALPRLDTNDLPKDKNALKNDWFNLSS